jgi:hypothetical protein
MPTQTIFYIFGSGILALLIALFQYIYKSKHTLLHWSLAGVRFISVFSLLLLIINPKFENKESKIIKPTLAVVVDNSQSVKYLNKDSVASNAVQSLLDNAEITSKYDVKVFSFGKQINQNSTLTFKDAQTNITNSLREIESLYDSQLAPVVLISDGNQTIGEDYEFASKDLEQVVFPLILGDSIVHSDLKIQQINVNKYTYLNNKFPVEIITSYKGKTHTQSELIIQSRGRIIYKQRLRFSPTQNSIIVTPKLTSSKLGLEQYQVTLTPLENEKNSINNQKLFAIETIDEHTKIALVTLLSHPDLGAIKTAIETNKQRLVQICLPTEYLTNNETYGLVILYQPNQSFKPIFDLIEKRKLNTFILAGPQTKWTFLNSVQSDFKQEITAQSENYQGVVNLNFNNFSVDNFTFDSYPPITSEFGDITINVPHETLVFKSINGISLREPLLFTYENNYSRTAVLLAENLWKWRIHSFREDQNFETFDSFMAKLIQYLNIKIKKTRLFVKYESIYDGSSPLEISAQFFNENYEPNPNADLKIILHNNATDEFIEYPMMAIQNNYVVNLNALEPGGYSFEVYVNGGTHRFNGAIEILEFNIEKQFVNANVQDLKQLAIYTKGTSYFDTQMDELISKLISDKRFSNIQKFSKKAVHLISVKLWLLILLFSLATEWLIRKYNGLI